MSIMRSVAESAWFWATILAEAGALWWREVHRAWVEDYGTWPA